MKAGLPSAAASGRAQRVFAAPGSLPATARQARSFLVRVWLEPREADGAAALMRCWARELVDGGEKYFADGAALVDWLQSEVAETCDQPRVLEPATARPPYASSRTRAAASRDSLCAGVATEANANSERSENFSDLRRRDR